MLVPREGNGADQSRGLRDALRLRDEVRFSIDDSTSPKISGVVLGMSDSTLTIEPDSGDAQREWAWDRIRALEKYTGSTPGFAEPILLGGLAGAVVGGVVGYASGTDECTGQELCFDRGGSAFLLGVTGLAVGLMTGFVFGMMIQRDVWVSVEP
jgi:hypothetical protein